MATGWQRLGEMLSGGGSGGDEAYRARLMENARMGTALGQDRALRLKEAALLGLDEALLGGGNTPEQARMLATIGRAGGNPEQYTGAGIDIGTRRAQDAAFEAVRSGGGMAAANPYLALQQGKPVELSDIKGDTVFNPYDVPLDQALVTTELGRARIGEREAAAQENLAQGRAAETRAQLNTAKRTNPSAFYNTGEGGVGTLGAPTMTGPRGIPIVSTGDKVLDRENWGRVQSGLEALDVIESLKELSADERNFGLVGSLRGVTQNLIQQGNAMAKQFGGEAARIRNEIQAGAADVDMAQFDERLPLINLMANVLAYKQARALSGSGQLSNQDFNNARVGIDPTSMLANRQQFLAAINAIEQNTVNQIARFTPQAQADLGIPGVLADRLGVGAQAPRGGPQQMLGIEGETEFNALPAQERVKAQQFLERGVPFHVYQGRVMEGEFHQGGTQAPTATKKDWSIQRVD